MESFPSQMIICLKCTEHEHTKFDENCYLERTIGYGRSVIVIVLLFPYTINSENPFAQALRVFTFEKNIWLGVHLGLFLAD